MRLGHENFRRLCLARDLLMEVRDRPMSIGEIARLAQMSPFHVIRQFEAVFGATPHQFRIDARVNLAKRLLAAGRHSVTETCMDVGFSSLGSFSLLFTGRDGETPSAYRRRVHGMVSLAGRPRHELFPGCLTLLGPLPTSAFRHFREA
jgi:AraC-like DNA-binding protein